MDGVQLLLTRRSAARVQDPGPSPEELGLMVESALGAPDHGRLRPWRFIVIAKDVRETLAGRLAARWRQTRPAMAPDALERETAKLMRAPVIVVVVARVVPDGKIPEIEQMMSAAAAAQNILLAAHALNYGAMWRTGNLAYDADMKAVLGLEATDAIVGFIYMGTPLPGAAPSQPRPDVRDFMSFWRA
ncbi:MAG: nitroreductase [Burkholderiaceae bacterium]